MRNYDYYSQTKPNWKSRGLSIQASNSHPGLFTIGYPDGGFISVNSTEALMLQMHPEDKTKHNGTTKK